MKEDLMAVYVLDDDTLNLFPFLLSFYVPPFF